MLLRAVRSPSIAEREASRSIRTLFAATRAAFALALAASALAFVASALTFSIRSVQMMILGRLPESSWMTRSSFLSVIVQLRELISGMSPMILTVTTLPYLITWTHSMVGT